MPKREVIYGGYGNLILALFSEDPKDLLPIGDEDAQKINQALDSLHSREAEVIKLRFGLNSGSEGLTLKEVSEKIDVTPERVRQIEAKALRKLRYRPITKNSYNWFKSSAQSKIESLAKENEQLKAEVEKYKSCLLKINHSATEIVGAIKSLDTTPVSENLFRSVGELELSVRSANNLKLMGIRLMGDLVSRKDEDLLLTKNFGRKSLNEIKEILAEMGLSLGMAIPGGWPPIR